MKRLIKISVFVCVVVYLCKRVHCCVYGLLRLRLHLHDERLDLRVSHKKYTQSQSRSQMRWGLSGTLDEQCLRTTQTNTQTKTHTRRVF